MPSSWPVHICHARTDDYVKDMIRNMLIEEGWARKTTPSADPRPDPLEALREAREVLVNTRMDLTPPARYRRVLLSIDQALAKINAVMGEAG